MRRRRRQDPPDLTSLFDVLFIVIFAALIRAAAVQQAAAAKPPPAPPRTVPIAAEPLHDKAVAQLASRPTAIVRISAEGKLTALEDHGTTTPLDIPLLERTSDPDVALRYLGDRICARVPEPHDKLVILAPAQRLADLPHALFDGLQAEVERCWTENHALAVIVDE